MSGILLCNVSRKVMNRWICLITLVLVFPLSSKLYAAQISVQEAAQRLQEKYDKTSSMSADFLQETSSQMSSRAKKGQGSMILLKPGRMRWDYLEPDRQVIVCDGKIITMYFAQEKQMLVSPAKQYLESDVAYSFFAGNGNLLRDFTIEVPAEGDLEAGDGDILLRLSPKKDHPQVDFITIWTDERFLINRLQIVDKFGSKTDIKFNNMILNPKISEEQFLFTPPPGTEIINQ